MTTITFAALTHTDMIRITLATGEAKFDVCAEGQIWENYGAHTWDGEGECPQGWKPKGSHERVVARDLTFAEAQRYITSAQLPEGECNDYFDWTPSCFVVYPAGLTAMQRIDYRYSDDPLTLKDGVFGEDDEPEPLPYEEFTYLEGWYRPRLGIA